jgi:hypothetical protein
MDIATRLPIFLGAGQTALSVRTSEDWRLRLVIEEAARTRFPGEKVPIIFWDCVKGFFWYEKRENGEQKPLPFTPNEDYTGLLAALIAAANLPSLHMPKGIFFFNDPHDFLGESVSCRRQVKNMINELQLAASPPIGPGHKRIMILVHPGPLHHELQNYVIPIDFPLPSEEEHDRTIGAIRTASDKTVPDDLRAAMAAACVGLTWKQAEDAVSESMMRYGLVPAILSSIEQTKADLLGQQGFLHYVPMEKIPPVDSIQGFEAVHEFLTMAAQAHLPRFAEMQLDRPKGMLLMGIAGTGKCVGIGTPILMYDGTVHPVEAVMPGDLLMGPDSRPRRVLGTTRGRGPLYRVRPMKGSPYVVNGDHVLSLKHTATARTVNLPVREYLTKGEAARDQLKGWRTGVDWPARRLPIPPYILGIWLGDGHNLDPVMVTTADPEVVTALNEYADSLGLRFVIRAEKGKTGTYAIVKFKGGNDYDGNDFLNNLRELQLPGNKHIPQAYLANSRSLRLELLAGLVDSDGHLSCGGYEIITKYADLATGILFLARSLGFAAYAKTKEAYCQTGGGGIYIRIFISGDVAQIPVRVPRRKAEPRRQKRDPLRTGITVEPIGEGDYYGFELDGDHLFLLGDFTVSHNSMMGKLASRIFYDVTGKRFPLYLLNVPSLFGGIVGQTEANVRWVTETLSAQGHYLLVIDELEKMLATSGFNGDSGVSLRAVGQILTWLSERTSNPRDKGYVVGTLNTVEGIRPEFFRRFDGVFYTDLPTPTIRREILEYHFRARGADPAKIMSEDAWQTIVLATDRFIGSELEDIVVQSKWKAAAERNSKTPNFQEIEEVTRDRASSIVSRTHGAMIEAIRDYCRTAARPVHVEKLPPRQERKRQVQTGEN